MTLLTSIATFVFSKTNAVLFTQILGIVFVLASATLNSKIADILRQFEDTWQKTLRVLSFLGGLTYYPLMYWILMGMEMGLLSTLLLTGVKMIYPLGFRSIM
jgi:hypothetical protein